MFVSVTYIVIVIYIDISEQHRLHWRRWKIGSRGGLGLRR